MDRSPVNRGPVIRGHVNREPLIRGSGLASGWIGWLLPALQSMVAACAPAPEAAPVGGGEGGVATFEVDPWWPPPLPEDWVLGPAVDSRDHAWIGSYTQHQVLKFTRGGEHLLTIGELGGTGGSHDPTRLGTPAGIWVDPETNEAFIADGYINRRIAVFDGDTGEFLRQWGAHGEAPDHEYTHPDRGADLRPSREFGTGSSWWMTSVGVDDRRGSSSAPTTWTPTRREISTSPRPATSGVRSS